MEKVVKSPYQVLADIDIVQRADKLLKEEGGIEQKFEPIQLPSPCQIGDKVQVYFSPNVILETCSVIKVHFTNSSILYDIEVRVSYIGTDGSSNFKCFRLYNLDSGFIIKV